MSKKITPITALTLFLVALFALFFGRMGVAQADSVLSAANNGSIETMGIYNDNRTFRGDDSRQDAYFEIGKGLKIQSDSYLDLYFSHSESLIPDYSTLTIYMDDLPLASMNLDASNAKITQWKIPLGELDLNPGIHKITFWGKLKVSINACEAPDNSSAWLVLHDTSKINLAVAPLYDKADLSWYPSPFFEKGAPNPLKSIFAVPDDITEAEFTVAAKLSQFFASQSSGNPLPIEIYPESELNDEMLKNDSIIWIGEQSRWKSKGKQAFGAINKTAKSGFLAEIASPWNTKKTHLLISGDDTQLLRGGDILTNGSLYGQLSGDFSPIPDRLNEKGTTLPDDAAQDNESSLFSLEQLGYNNLVTEKVLEGGSSINYSMPNNWDIGDGGTFHLKYQHSTSVVLGQSVMTVRLNGTPVYSKKFQEETAKAGEIEIKLDPEIIGASRNINIDVQYQFVNSNASDSDSDSSCTGTILGNWAIVDKSSYFKITSTERSNFNLDSLPFPFFSGRKWEPVTFLLGKTGSKELSIAMNLFGKMGASIPLGSDIRLASVKVKELASKLQDRNVIYVGESSDMPAFLNGYDASYVKFNHRSLVSRSEHVNVLSELTEHASVVQLTRSPLNEARNVLILGATDASQLTAISRFLTDPDKRFMLNGRLVLIDGLNRVHEFPDTADLKEPASPVDGGERPERSRALPYGPYVFGGFLVAVMTFIVLFSLKLRRKNNR